MMPEPVVAWEKGFDALYGLDIVEITDERVRATVAVRDAVKQPMGLVHGGVYASMAESLASFGTAAGVVGDGLVPQGLANSTNFLRPITDGTIHADGVRRHRGRTTWVWDIEFTDDEGRLCAVTRMTIAVREPRA